LVEREDFALTVWAHEVAHLMSAIKVGIVPVTTKSELLSLEQKRDHLHGPCKARRRPI